MFNLLRVKAAGCLAILAISTGAAEAATYQTIYSFQNSPDGAQPAGDVAIIGSKLYGTTQQGGVAHLNHSWGTLFCVDLSTGTESVVHDFRRGGLGYAPEYGVVTDGQSVYGKTRSGGGERNNRSGTLFGLNPATGAATDFKVSWTSGMVVSHGALYSTTVVGGSGGHGSVLKTSLRRKMRTKTIYSFSGKTDGYSALAYPVIKGSVLYGTTLHGGGGAQEFGDGTIYRVDLRTGKEAVLYRFTGGADGINPQGDLVLSHGVLYGTATGGGIFGGSVCQDAGCGLVFGLNIATKELTVLHSFSGTDGHSPETGLTLMNGRLYGTVAINGSGGVFEINPTENNKFSMIYNPVRASGGLRVYNGRLYGVSTDGEWGSVYSISP